MADLPFLRSSISRKIVMSLTGGWLCAFLVVHMAGNLTLLLPAELARPRYNAYTRFMTGNPLVQVIAYLNYAAILVHVAVGLLLTVQNRRATPQRYACARPGETSPFHARHMGLLGALVLVFLVIHMKTFWFRYHYGEVPVDADGMRDMYAVVVLAFGQTWYVALYVAAMAILGLHLLHGFASGFRTIGVHHRRYWRWVQWLGVVFAIAVSLAFAAMPIYVHLAAHQPHPG